MLRDILRFNRAATALALQAGGGDACTVTLGAYLDAHGYGAPFRDWYLLPMAACIWSCPPARMLAFPIASFVRFCHNHGLLQVSDRPQWRTVAGGSRNYVDKMLAAIPERRLDCPVLSVRRNDPLAPHALTLGSARGDEQFDQVVLACHSDQSLALLGKDPAHQPQRELLAAVRYQSNRAVLHTDTSCLPANRKAWSAWNYQGSGGADPQVCVHYLINQLQPLPFEQAVIVSLNPIDPPDPACVLGEFDYAHPVFDAAAVAAQAQLAQIQGRDHVWLAGAWTGYGFHEDGLKSGIAVADAIVHLAQGDAAGANRAARQTARASHAA